MSQNKNTKSTGSKWARIFRWVKKHAGLVINRDDEQFGEKVKIGIKIKKLEF